MKISVVMAYFNRRMLLESTLHSLNLSNHKDIEVIIVDDGSKEEEKINDLINKFNFEIKLIEVKDKPSTRINACVPFNMGFREVTGEAVIIQNPECLHVGDVISYCNNNILKNKYLTFATYSIGPEKIKNISQISKTSNSVEELTQRINMQFEPYGALTPEEKGPLYTWYNHSIFRPSRYHFLSCINRDDLCDLNGFNEEFALGTGFDDNEFLERVTKKQMEISIVDDPFCIHQYHKSVEHESLTTEKYHSMGVKNLMLYQQTKNSPEYRTNNKMDICQK